MTHNFSLHRRCVRTGLAAGALFASVLFGASAMALQAPNLEMPKGERHESRMAIDQLEEKWRDAILKDDAVTMGTLLADDYTGITAYGTLQSKEDTLSSMRSGRLHLTLMDISDRKVRFYGTTALVTSTAMVQGASPDGNVTGNYRYSHVYVKDAQGDWKIVNFEASRVGHPHPHHNRPK
jgi:ketosteroid isomerase-like protein